MSVFAQVGNVSEGGMFVRTARPLRPGAKAVLRFRLGDVEHEVPAVVVWKSRRGAGGPPGMGLRFTAAPAGALEGIRALVETVHGRDGGRG